MTEKIDRSINGNKAGQPDGSALIVTRIRRIEHGPITDLDMVNGQPVYKYTLPDPREKQQENDDDF